MDSMTITLPAPLGARLQAMADHTGRPVEDCLRQAVADYLDQWEGHMNDLWRLDREERVILRVHG